MKQVPLFVCRSIATVFFVLSSVSVIESAQEFLQLPQKFQLNDPLDVYLSCQQDGFVVDTLVKTRYGYQYIAQLAQADFVSNQY